MSALAIRIKYLSGIRGISETKQGSELLADVVNY